MKRFWLALLVLVVLAGCGSVQESGIDPIRPTPDPADAVARITYRNGIVEYISQNELDDFSTQLATLAGAADPPPQVALEILVERKLMLYLARTTDTAATPEEIQQFVDLLTGPQGYCAGRVPETGTDTRTYLDECARASGFQDGTAFRNFLSEELTIDKVTRQQAPPDLIRTAHILTEDYETAARTYDRVQETPGQFAEIAREVSIDPGSAPNGGELPPFNEQGLTTEGQQFDSTYVSNTLQLRDEFEQTGDAISEPFQTDFGWHIVRILGLEASQESATQFRDAVLNRALSAQPSDLTGNADTGDVPLLAAVEVLREFPTPEPVQTPEALPELPAEPEVSPAPEETPVPLEDGAEAPGETPEPLDGTPANESEPAEPNASPSP